MRTINNIMKTNEKLFKCPSCDFVYQGGKKKVEYLPDFPSYGLPRLLCPDCRLIFIERLNLIMSRFDWLEKKALSDKDMQEKVLLLINATTELAKTIGE